MISSRLKAVILRELDLEDFPIEETTVAHMVPGWDSLSHVRVITAVEAEYGLRFRSVELIRLRNVGDLQALIDRNLTT
ncbi:MAG TPA: acyl carrier protein [Candidatus Methylomirabilis sp.]|nr:acyl carrier protein [Candidatus Methylomirabilis sp.]